MESKVLTNIVDPALIAAAAAGDWSGAGRSISSQAGKH